MSRVTWHRAHHLTRSYLIAAVSGWHAPDVALVIQHAVNSMLQRQICHCIV
jgi:hypothetical protein